MKKFVSVLCLLGVVLGQDGPESVRRGTKEFEKRVVISGLEGPWEMTLGPDDMLWVTERTGKRIVRVNPKTGVKVVAATLGEVDAPGGQDGLLGMALHPELLKGTGKDFVYVAYTYQDVKRGPDTRVVDEKSPYRHLYSKIVRLTYDEFTQTLSRPLNVITGMPAGNDHNSLRLKFGPDAKLYLGIGDQGNNQLGNYCLPVLAQRLPTKAEMAAKNFASYEGKVLRINLDGSVPADNPLLEGVVSHVFTYGHRNPQGLSFGPDGTLYAAEHGPKTDDEVDVLKKGGNYGWPHVAGMRDDQAFEYARWAEAKTPCSELRFSDLAIHPSVPREKETDFKKPMIEPIATMFTVPTGYNFSDPKCKGIDYICWPTIGISGAEYYSSGATGIPGWDKVLFVTTLKRGSLYVLPLSADGQKAGGKFWRYFQSENRYRDTAVSKDGRTIYIATDPGGLAESKEGGATTKMENRGAILAFTYKSENGATAEEAKPVQTTTRKDTLVVKSGPVGEGAVPTFTAKQVADGKVAYNSYCAVCHGSTMTNGTFGTPLAGEYFKNKWPGQSVHEFFEKSKTMPPAAPASLSDAMYADIVAYVLEYNGQKPGAEKLPAGGEALKGMSIR
jgi:PQQ-dependent dehydrogenase (s-GDH family)